ncbi:MAG: 50S ribosomal protein L22 [Euryarchaeota archaeon]|nr:50S ribosomal protein L22 [Euryarchaeota archaeon]
MKMSIKYSIKPDPETTARAMGRELHVKPKYAVNVCRAVRGMPLTRAKKFLEDVMEKKVAVPYFRHIRHVQHRPGKIGPGRYPVKTASKILEMIKAAEANAEYKGLDPEKMYISHISAQKAASQAGSRPRAQGRATPWNTSRCHVEVVLSEKKEA